MLNLRKHRLIMLQVLRPARTVGRIQKSGGSFLRQFANQAEHIAHIEGTLVHKYLMRLHTNEHG